MGQPPRDHVCVANKSNKAAAGARIGAELGKRKRNELLGRLRPHFARTAVFLQASAYLLALMSSLPSRNGWSIAEFIGDKAPDKTQRLLNRASWPAFAAMSEVRKFAAEGLDEAARKRRRRRGRIRVGALDETARKRKAKTLPVSSASIWAVRTEWRMVSIPCIFPMPGRKPATR